MSKIDYSLPPVYVKVYNIHWNEGPEEGYTGPKEFWFVIDKWMYDSVKDDPINGLALFQEIDNQLDDCGLYGGVVSDRLKWKMYTHTQLRKKYKKGSIEAIDLTREGMSI